MHVTLVRHAVADEFRHGEHLHIVRTAELDQVGNARHGAVVAHDFADDAGGNQAGEPRQIDGGFGLSGADQHPTFACAQREDVPRTREVRWARGGIDRDLNRAGPVVGRDSGGDAVAGVDGFAECRAVVRSVFGGHGPDAQVFKALFGHGQADQSAAVLGHEIDGFGRDFFGGQREVAFVLAIFVVDDHDHAAGADLLDRGRDVGKGCLGTHSDCDFNKAAPLNWPAGGGRVLSQRHGTVSAAHG